MAEILKKSYEISIWEDVLTTEYWPKNNITIEGITYVKNKDVVPADIAIEYCESQQLNFDDVFNTIQYYDEERVAVIGSDTMDSPTRAFEPNLKRNINGTVTLNFFIYIRYYDEETDSYKENPFIESLLVNERKLKFRYGNEWFDCIIKNADEDKENNMITFTTADLFINELSKTGFSIELETELGNNIGTIEELAQKVVDGTEWEINEVDNFIERQESNLYSIVLTKDLQATSLIEEEEVTIEKGKRVFGFYQSVVDWQDKEETRLQIIYSTDGIYEIDEDRFIFEKIDDSEKYSANEYWIYPEGTDIVIGDISYDYKGRRLIQSTSTIYDPVAKKVVERYLDQDDNEVYMYYENKYYATSVVNNLISNGEKFVNDECWISNPAGGGMVSHSIYPSIDNTFPIEQFHNFLRFSGAQDKQNRAFLNTGFVQNLADYTGFAKSDKYVFRISYGKATTDEHGIPTALPSPIAGGNGIKSIKIQDYKINSDGSFKFGSNIYFNFNTTAGAWHTANGDYNCYNMFSGTQFSTGVTYYEKEGDLYVQTTDTVPDASKRYYYRSVVNDYIYCVDQCNTALSYSKMLSGIRDYTHDDTSGWQIGVFIQFEAPGSGKDYYVEGIQLFQYQEDAMAVVPVEGDPADYILLPGMIPQSSVTKNYYYYNKPQLDFTDIEEVEWRYKGTEKQAEFTPIIEEGLDKYIKRRTITAKESNRFNLIQSLCELFECWARFEVERDEETGKIIKEYLLDEEGIYSDIRRKKSISFLEYIGKDNWIGFKYGINLKQISRSDVSDQIVTKLIVKDNANEHATNGFCSIARADENPSYSNFILNVDYYIKQGMISNQEWIADLYTETNGHLGYYKNLYEYKKDFANLQIEKSEINRTIDNLQSEETVYISIIDESIERQDYWIDQMYGLTKLSSTTPLETVISTLRREDWKNNADAQSCLTSYNVFTSNISYYTPLLESIEQEIYNATERAARIDDIIEEAKAKIEEIEAKFYRKYARYIQEGSWISEDYVDDNLYFLDAESVLYTSAFPQVSYSINVIDCLNSLENNNQYRDSYYDIKIGDKTFIEDTEFFGYYLKDGIPTPYQEEVVISETLEYFDSPEKNTFTIQNYKTQFEDLFQRITATTQSLQYSTGEYQRAAGAIQANGTIDATIIQNSITSNSINLSNAKNQSVVWGADGLTTTNLSNPLEIVRLTSGGLYVSSDGGVNYTTGVSAYGINTSLLSAGRINSENINIYSGSFPTFIWDKYGISAYVFGETENGQAYVDYGKFVRYDQYGLYGIEATLVNPTTWRPDPDNPLNDIEDKAKFGLLWDRFFLKSDAHGGKVRISSTDDIQVLDANNAERIKIGRLTDEDIASYGIRIKDGNNSPVMETGSDGDLWIKGLLQVGNGDSEAIVTIGYDPQETIDFKKHITHEIINANDNFVVYEDGCFYAENAEIHGAIYAESGKIGNMTIEEVGEGISSNRRIEINASAGFSFKTSGSNITTPSNTILSLKPYGFGEDYSLSQVKWYYSNNLTSWTSLGEGNTYNFVYQNEKVKFSNDQIFIKATAQINNQGYETIIQTIYDVKDGAPGTSTVTAILSNEDQMIACDKDGNPKAGAFSEAYTTVTIYEGNEEKTDEWTITYSPSSGLTGQWDSVNHKYTVTNLTQDVGFVLFQFSKDGKNPPVERKFTLTKVYTGADGTSPTIYSLETSAIAVNKKNDDSYNPSQLIINSYSQVGNENKTPYSGVFKIYKDDVLVTTTPQVSSYTIDPIDALQSYKIELYDSNNLVKLDSQAVVITYDGEKGERGEQGQKGDNATVWRINTDQVQILRYYNGTDHELSNNGEVTFNVYSQTNGISTIMTPVLNQQTPEEGIFSPHVYTLSQDGTKTKIENDAGATLITISGNNVILSLSSLLNMSNSPYIGIIIEASFTSINETSIAPTIFIPVSNATSEDLAKFSLHARDITMSVEKASLVFNDKGLSVGNGNFEIIKTTEGDVERLLYTDDEGDLHIKGALDAASGTFSGELVAATGTFSGTLQAADGTFGGTLTAPNGSLGELTIADTITAGNMSLSSDGTIESNYEEGISGFRLDPSGIVYANNIKLGTSAEIKKYIQIGNSTFLYNSRINKETDLSPADEKAYLAYTNGDIISAIDENNQRLFNINADGSINIDGNGRITVGSLSSSKGILINANKDGIPYIETLDYSTGSSSGWHIDGDNAIFNNITARGSIKSAVFEYSEIQTVGGVIIVRPSTTIQSKNNNTLYVASTVGFSKDDYCLLGGGLADHGLSPYKISSIDEKNSTITFENGISQLSENELIGLALINMGSGVREVGLAINSSKNEPLSGIKPQSLDVFETYLDTNSNEIKIDSKIILGKLPNKTEMAGLNDSYKGGTYGLYAENAYLKGALISYNGSISSGFDSNSDVDFSAPDITNPGKVVLWAGAPGDRIGEANFRVDTNGNLYAGSGYFTGTIITDSVISASKLQTVVIEGTGPKEVDGIQYPAALTIKDTQKGIDFQNGNESVFILKNDGVTSTIPLNVSNTIKANRVYTGTNSSTFLPTLGDNKLGFVKSTIAAAGDNNSFQYYFNTDDDNIYLRNDSDNSIISINTTQIALTATKNGTIGVTSKSLNVNSSEINYSGIMNYKQVEGGYDLYVN